MRRFRRRRHQADLGSRRRQANQPAGGCIAAALDKADYRMKLAAAGFEAISVEPTHIYKVDDAREFLSGKGVDVDVIAPLVDGKFMSAIVRAKKPGQSSAQKAGACCAPDCCGA